VGKARVGRLEHPCCPDHCRRTLAWPTGAEGWQSDGPVHKSENT
jgi:hypothetical protein